MTTNRRSSPAAALVAIAVMLLPVAYALSVGLYVWLRGHGFFSDSADVIFLPLLFLHDRFKPAGDLLEWYTDLWQ